MLSAALKVLGGKQDGKLIPLAAKKFLIGREQDCHLRPNSDSVSRHHCVITIDDFGIHVRDLGSSNGTHLNSIRIIGLREVKNGDRLRIGSLEFEFVCRKGASIPAAVNSPMPSGSEFSIDDFALPDVAPVEETAVIAKSDTVVMKAQQVTAPITPSNDETQPLESELPEPAIPEIPQVAAAVAPEFTQPVPQQPQVPGYDPAMYPPGMAPGGYPYAQPQAYPGYGMGMPQQMPMPGYPYGMPQQQQSYPYMQQPGYMPQMPQQMYGMQYPQQGYPQQGYQQPGYAQPGYPQQGYGYPQQAPMSAPPAAEVEEAAPVASTSGSDPIPVRLPLPEDTGAKAPEVKQADGTPKPPAPNPAADVLKKMMTRR